MKRKAIRFLAIFSAVAVVALSSYGVYAALVRQTVTVDAGVTVTVIGAKRIGG